MIGRQPCVDIPLSCPSKLTPYRAKSRGEGPPFRRLITSSQFTTFSANAPPIVTATISERRRKIGGRFHLFRPPRRGLSVAHHAGLRGPGKPQRYRENCDHHRQGVLRRETSGRRGFAAPLPRVDAPNRIEQAPEHRAFRSRRL